MSVLNRQVGGSHYTDKIQHVEFVVANGIPYLEAQAMRYLCRHEKKNGKEDVFKALHYLEMILEMTYGVDRENQPILTKTEGK
jgi:hypothetical protein